MSGSAADPEDAVPSRFHVDFTGRTLLGTYVVERVLAEGGMGSVYLARDTSLGMRVVVKVPHARFLGEPGFRARFRREIEELVRLEHPRVARILARGEEDEVPYFVLQYLGGGSLEDRLKKARQAPAEALGWLVPVAATLDFVHGRGVVHRDVKPGNILFDEAGHVFLSDFGVVKALGRDDGERTEVGTGVGSPLYMAPEQCVGREVTGAADQYALAATCHEALAGEPPFGRGNPIEVILRKQREAPPSLAGRVEGLPEAADAALRRALDADPARRFPSCAAFAEAFRAAVVPREASPRRGRGLLAAAALGVLAIAAAGALTGGFGLAGSRPAPSAGPKSLTIVVLAKEGSEPRRTLRYGAVPGRTDRFVFDMTRRMRLARDGAPPFEQPLSSTQEVETRVEAVEADGRARIAWTLSDPRLPEKEGAPASPAAGDAARTLVGGGARATTVHSARGEVLDFEAGRPAPGRERAQVDGEEVVRSFELVLPEEPVGVGAVWNVTQAGTMVGIRFQMTATYELVSLEGNRVALRLETLQTAPPQEFTLPGAPEGTAPAKISGYRGTGRGEAVLDLDNLSPVSMSVEGTVLVEMWMGPEDQRFKLTNQIEYAARVVR